MLRSMREIIGYDVKATDDTCGKVHDLFFDAAAWAIRHMVVEAGTWLEGRRVLISPAEMGVPDPFRKLMPVSLTKAQVESSPSMETHLPWALQRERELIENYRWMTYWAPMSGESPAMMVAPVRTEQAQEQPAGDVHLRSVNEVLGYRIRATDRKIGHVADFIADTEKWEIRYMVVDTGKWLPGRKVLVAPAWVKEARWADRKVYMDVSSDEIRHSPEFDPTAPVNRQYEVRLYDYYGRPKYWQRPMGKG